MNKISFTTTLDNASSVGYTCLVVPGKVVKEIGGFSTRLLCSVNKNELFHCGLVRLGNGNGGIILNKKRRTDWEIDLEDTIEVTLMPDSSKYGVEMPEELEALLELDKEAASRFETITPGQQRYIINYVNGVKSSQKRIDRAIMLIENLKKMPEGTFDFRQLLGKEPKNN